MFRFRPPTTRTFGWVIALVGVALLANACSSSSDAFRQAGGVLEHDHVVLVDGDERVYDLYVPANARDGAPLVLLLHGNRGTRDDLTGRDRDTAPFAEWFRIADANNVILLIPQGAEADNGNTGWNDCRADAFGNPALDDVAFLTLAIDQVEATRSTDTSSVYAVGFSNGGHMAQRLADEAAQRLAGIAVISAGVSVNSACATSSEPMPAVFIWGTADLIAPFDGGRTAGGRGEILGAEASIARWVQRNGADPTPDTVALDDLNTDDDSTVERITHAAGEAQAAVVLYRVEGGGHIEPSIAGHYRRVFERVVGRQNHDIEMADEVWGFFSTGR